MILVDTSVLIDALTGPNRAEPDLRAAIKRGNRMGIPSLVLFEWLRGPRTRFELAVQEGLFPADKALPFGPREARVAADLYRKVASPRSREVDLAIAACAISIGAELWTHNISDFIDIPGLSLYAPP